MNKPQKILVLGEINQSKLELLKKLSEIDNNFIVEHKTKEEVLKDNTIKGLSYSDVISDELVIYVEPDLLPLLNKRITTHMPCTDYAYSSECHYPENKEKVDGNYVDQYNYYRKFDKRSNKRGR